MKPAWRRPGLTARSRAIRLVLLFAGVVTDTAFATPSKPMALSNRAMVSPFCTPKAAGHCN